MIKELKPHQSYKNAGVHWLAEIPYHWDTHRAKTLFHERVQKGFPREPMLAATQNMGVVRKEEYGNRTVTAQKDFHLLKLVLPGDFVISLRSFQGGIEYAHERGIISPAYTVLTPADSSSAGYWRHAFKSAPFVDSMQLYVTGIREGQNIDYSRLSRSLLPVPPPEEQKAIVKFLDHANRRIDTLIDAKKKQIDLLNEQKQVIIQQAVTKGLNPDVQMKPSDVDWLGDIPAHWDVVRNMALFSERKQTGIPGLPILQVSLKSGVTREDLDQFGRPKKYIADHIKYALVRAGDLAYNTMRMWQGAVGVVPCDGLVSPAYVVVKPRGGVVPEFYDLMFHTGTYMQQVNRYSTGIASDRNRLYWDKFKQMPNVQPPKTEQSEIVEVVEKACLKPNLAIAMAKDEMELLQEYRTRLTADVVTGKLDVRNASRNLEKETS